MYIYAVGELGIMYIHIKPTNPVPYNHVMTKS